MKKIPLLVALLTLLPFTASAQSSESSYGEEDAVVLSPFSVTADADASYSTVSTMSGTRIGTPVVDGQSSNGTPNTPITLVKRADAVVIQFVLSNSEDKQTTRNQGLYAAVQQIQSSVQKTPGLRMEQREVRFAGGNRKFMSFSRDAQQSYASIVIFADLSPDLRLADRVKQVRDLLDRIKFPASTKLADGFVGLYIKQPSSYRREILQKVFDDLEFVKKGLGAEFEVHPSGLNQRVRIRACSETEVELWIDYSFSIDSVRALTNKKDA